MASENCPTCGAILQNKFFSLSTNHLLTERQNRIVSLIFDRDYTELCHKCGYEDYFKAQQELNPKINELKGQLNELVANVPLVTVHNPSGWDYEVIGMVTAQSATGTGVITEFISSFTDLTGAQSERHKSKLKAGEEMCKAQLQLEAVADGGNAVIGVDVDYSEIGSGKGILMVCMSGTAVKLRNINVLGDKMNALNGVSSLLDRIKELADLQGG